MEPDQLRPQIHHIVRLRVDTATDVIMMLRNADSAVVLCFLSLIIREVIAECPSEHDLPVMFNSTHYLGSHFYPEGNAASEIQACSTTPNPHEEGYNADAYSFDSYFIDHALIVRPGCTVYEFTDPNFQGSVNEYPSGVYPNILSNNYIQSYKVRCDIEHIECSPDDEYSNVVTCDAINTQEDTTCFYVKTIGTAYTQSISESMSLDTSLQEQMETTFFGLFSQTLGVSVNTGYDWNHVSEITKGAQERFEVSDVAPAGYVLTIDQAVGQCGGSVVNTEHYRITQENRDGESTVKFVKASRDNAPLV